MTDLEHPTPLVMAETHALRIPDGTRELEIGRPGGGIRADRADVAYGCFTAQHRRLFDMEMPRSCQVTIEPGRWFIVWNSARFDKQKVRYCAPCAHRDWSAWDVREVAS